VRAGAVRRGARIAARVLLVDLEDFGVGEVGLVEAGEGVVGEEDRRRAGIHVGGLAHRLAGLGGVVLLQEEHAQGVEGHGVGGVEGEGAADLRLGLGEPLILKQGNAQAVAREGVVGAPFEHPAIDALGLGPLAAHVVGNAEVDERLVVVRIARNRVGQGRHRLGEAEQTKEQRAVVVA
jgi:hypothetical protein